MGWSGSGLELLRVLGWENGDGLRVYKESLAVDRRGRTGVDCCFLCYFQLKVFQCSSSVRPWRAFFSWSIDLITRSRAPPSRVTHEN
jgi:hypothetical protein